MAFRRTLKYRGAMLRTIAHRLLESPVVFQLQQRLCNNYSSLKEAFPDYFDVIGKYILDVGCSTAACAGQIIDMEKNSYVGVDIDPKYVELAKKMHPCGRFLHGDARTLPFDNDSFDLVMFNGVWHHMDDDLIRSCMKEVSRVLRRTGSIVVSEPVFRSDWPVSTWLLKNDRGKYIRDRAGYRALFEGLSIVEERTLRIAMHEFAGFVARK
jgi:ubiquinone/menaquinone biosynthesis C-methylase UbiE